MGPRGPLFVLRTISFPQARNATKEDPAVANVWLIKTRVKDEMTGNMTSG
jgi:hypothetical protein